MFETIVALATPPLKSALAIIRFSGDDCFDVVNKIFSKDLNKYNKNSIVHGYIKDNDDIIDEVVLLLYIAPHSFTGENSVEVICHGSSLIFNKIIEAAIKNGARMAKRGEYSLRAYLHKKIDLIQAESINDLINAETEESKRLSLLSLEGKTSKLIAPLKEDIGELLANIEVNIDYPEYNDVEIANEEKILRVCKKNIDYVDNLVKDGEKGKIIKEGINVAIVGKPNVGKSSILNALLNEDKAIVTDIKGTTRDVVEGKINLNGVIINLFDTAGIRKSNDKIEEIGIKKSIEKINSADIVIMVYSNENKDKEDLEILNYLKTKDVIEVYNKSDLIKNKNNNNLYISALNKDIKSLKDAIINKLGLEKRNYTSASINNSRQIGLLNNIKKLLEGIILDCENKVPIDLIAEKIRDVYLKILSLIGEDYDFDITKEIFSRFCVGK